MSKPIQIEPSKISDVAMTLVYQTLWNKIPNKSFISGLWLRELYNTPLWKACFYHVLSIKDYPGFRYFYGNIVLMTPGERSLYEQCTPESLIHYDLQLKEKSSGKGSANWDAVKDLERELKELYKRNYPVTFKGIINHRYSLEEQQKIVSRLNKEFWDSFRK